MVGEYAGVALGEALGALDEEGVGRVGEQCLAVDAARLLRHVGINRCLHSTQAQEQRTSVIAAGVGWQLVGVQAGGWGYLALRTLDESRACGVGQVDGAVGAEGGGLTREESGHSSGLK